METKQTPDYLHSAFKHSTDLNKMYRKEIFDLKNRIKELETKLSSEIERIKGERRAALDTLRGESKQVKELKEKLSGKTSSCPVCDSMAERNRELYEGLKRAYGDSKTQRWTAETYRIVEQLLSKQNNKK